jgi:hypothetical protein
MKMVVNWERGKDRRQKMYGKVGLFFAACHVDRSIKGASSKSEGLLRSEYKKWEYTIWESNLEVETRMATGKKHK